MMKPRKQVKYPTKPIPNYRMQQLQQQHQQQYLQQVKRQTSEAINHDEAEAMNLRVILAQNFIKNQELLETLFERNVPLRNIVPPSSFPDSSLYNPSDPNSVWAGNLEKAEDIMKSLESDLNEEINYGLENEFYRRQKVLSKLNNLPQVIDEMKDLDSATEEVVKEFQKITQTKKTVKKKIVYKDVEVKRAPEDWYTQQEQMRAELEKEKREKEMKAQELKAEELKAKQEYMRKQQQLRMEQHLQPNLQSQQFSGINNQQYQQPEGMAFNMGGDELDNEIFNNELGNFIEDNGFEGLDNDFLSQIDHSME